MWALNIYRYLFRGFSACVGALLALAVIYVLFLIGTSFSVIGLYGLSSLVFLFNAVRFNKIVLSVECFYIALLGNMVMYLESVPNLFQENQEAFSYEEYFKSINEISTSSAILGYVKNNYLEILVLSIFILCLYVFRHYAESKMARK